MTIEIKSRYDGKVIYTGGGESLRATLIEAVGKNAYLRGADLRGADLRGADLGGAYLGGADLRGADLRGADLRGADLGGADLRGADLGGAYLGGAYLGGAYLRGADLREERKLIGNRPYLSISNIGSRNDTLHVFLTDKGVVVQTGYGPCFDDTIDVFEQAVINEHGKNEHGKDYKAAIAFIRAHAEIWMPVDEAAAVGGE